MLIKSLKYKNFRQFKGEKTIDFSCDRQKNVTIILGNNTFGKTTLLQMFNWCFYDKAIFNENSDFLLNLELASCMYNNDSEEVMVEITLLHEGKEYTINRKQEYLKINGKVISKDSKLKVSFKNLSTGKTDYIEKDKDMKSVINLILPEDLSGYFFFDTERVQNVAQRKDLSASVKGLLGLNILDNALKHLGKDGSKSTVIGAFYDELKETDDSNKAAQALNEIQAAEDNIEYYTQVRDDAESEIENYEQRKEKLEDKLRELKDTTELQKEKDDYTRYINSDKEALEKVYSDYPVLFGDDAVWFFAQPLYRQALEFLKQADINDKGISDVTANTILELIQNGYCLCGTKIEEGNDAYNHLIEQIKFVPPESIGTTIKNFKKDISQYNRINSNDKFYNVIQQKMGEIVKYNNRIDDWKDKINDIETKIAGKEDARKYQIELNDVKVRLKEKNRAKDNAIEKLGIANNTKDRFKKIYDALIAKSDKGKEIREYLAYAEAVQKWIYEYYTDEEGKIRSELQEHVNDIFQRMYHGERLLEINEKYQTVLYTVIPETGEKLISGESEGLLRVKNFAFIAGLVDLAKNKAISVGDKKLGNEPYPLILDAPFSNADEEHIKNISRELPLVAEQVIMFVMEKDWKYAETVILDRAQKKYVLEKHSDTYSTIN